MTDITHDTLSRRISEIEFRINEAIAEGVEELQKSWPDYVQHAAHKEGSDALLAALKLWRDSTYSVVRERRELTALLQRVIDADRAVIPAEEALQTAHVAWLRDPLPNEALRQNAYSAAETASRERWEAQLALAAAAPRLLALLSKEAP